LDYMAAKTRWIAEYVFDQLAFEGPLGLKDDGDIIQVANQIVLDGLASGKKEYQHNVPEPFDLDSEVVCTAPTHDRVMHYSHAPNELQGHLDLYLYYIFQTKSFDRRTLMRCTSRSQKHFATIHKS
jgi:hypothetical protein